MKKVHVAYSFILSFLLICTGCEEKEITKSNPFLDEINLTLNDHKSTKNNKNHTYQVQLKNSKDEAVEVDSVLLELEMKNMNHHTKGKMEKIDNGLYGVTLELPMDGNWIKHVTLKKDNYARVLNVR